MKKIVLILTALVLMLASGYAQDNAAVAGNENDSTGVNTAEAKNEKAEPREISASLSADFGEDVVIPIVAIVSVFGMPVLIILVIFGIKYKEKRARYEVMKKAIESGRELPANFFDQPEGKQEKGVVMIFVGVGLLLMLYFWKDLREFAPVGFLPLFIGVGQLIAWKLEQRNKPKEPLSQFPTSDDEEAKFQN